MHLSVRLQSKIVPSERTATKKCGFDGWKRTNWTAPLIFLNGACECLREIWWIKTLPLAALLAVDDFSKDYR